MNKRTYISNHFMKMPNSTVFPAAATHRLASAETEGYTVGEFLRKWLVSVKRNIGQRTFETYRQIVEKHLIPALGSIPLTEITPLDIDEYYTYALEAGRLDGKGGLSARSVNHHHRLLHAALAQALRWELIKRNPADAVRAPKPAGQEMSVLSEEQLAQLLKAARGSRAYIAILIAATTGARRGEVLALRWADLDLRSGKVIIRRSLQLTETGISFKEPKTRQSIRVVTLPRLTICSLKEHRKKQAQEMFKLGAQYKNFGLVCAQKDGTPINPARLSKYFLAIVRKNGISRVRFHDLRHTHATQLLSQGINPKVVSERLGHSSVNVTLESYSHVLPGMQEEVAKKIDAALSPALSGFAAR